MLRANGSLFTHNGTGGAGTLTLANVAGCPDPYEIFGAGTNPTGFSATHIVEYVINVFSSAIWSPANLIGQECGYGTLVVGGSIGATTLARTTITSTWLASGPTYIAGTTASALSISATAANVQIIIGPTASSYIMGNPFFEQALGDALGLCVTGATASAVTPPLVSGTDLFTAFTLDTPILIKRAGVYVTTVDAGASSGYVRIYEMGANGQPGRLLIDLGVLGTLGSSYIATGKVSTALATTGLWLPPGYYFSDVYSTVTNSPHLRASAAATSLGCAKLGSSSGAIVAGFSATGGSAPGPDPANLTSIAQITSNSPAIWLNNQ